MVGGSDHDRCRRAREWSSLRLDGELSELERLLLRRHLGRCEECRAFAAAIEGATRMVRTTPLEQLERPLAPAAAVAPRSRRRVRLVAATALVVVAAGIGAVVGAVVGSAGNGPAQPQQFPSVAFNTPGQTQTTPPTTGNI
jgi:predicted anti-sigma-YlaC factor YlaD